MEKITKDMLIGDLINVKEDAAEILMSFGMHCIGCAIAQGETIEEAAMVHGIDADALVDELNK